MELELERAITAQRVANTRYEVWALNDDNTAYDTVLEVFKTVFKMESKKAIGLVISIDKKGEGLVATYTCEDVAIMKAERGMNYAKDFQSKLAGCKDATLVLEVRKNGGDE